MQSYSRASSSRLDRQRHQLERVWQQAPQRSLPGLKPLQQLGNWLVTVFTGSSDPAVQQRETAHGTVWTVQEPGQPKQTFDSEDGVRIWLEQRYYRS